MKKTKFIILAIFLALTLVTLASCSEEATDTETTTSVTTPIGSEPIGNLPPLFGGEETTESLTAEEVYTYTTQDIFTSDKDASKKDLINTFDEEDLITLDLDADSVIINQEGTYLLSGTYEDLTIEIDVLDSEKVTLVLDDFNVTNSSTPVIYVKSADKVSIISKENTESSLSVTDSFLETEESADAVIYSKDDLTIKGTGTLNIDSSNDGVVSKDDLVLSSLSLNVTSSNNGIVGKDSLVVASGTYNVVSDKDAMKSNGDEENGVLIVNDGIFNLTANDDALSATNLILLEKGTFIIDSQDDAINSDGDIVLLDINLEIDAVDDAVTAYYDLQVDGASIIINTSYEGLEAKNIQILSGDIKITSTDDGVNASDSDDALVDTSNDPDGNYHSTSEEVIFSMFGGQLSIDASSDGIDSNGNIYIDGGVIEISGAETDMENPMDYNLNAVIVSGSVVSVGYSGMAQNFTVSESNISLMYNFGVEDKGTILTIKDEDGSTVYTYTLTKSASSILISTDKLTLGNTYTVEVGSNSETVTIESTITTIGVSSSNNMPGPMPGKN